MPRSARSATPSTAADRPPLGTVCESCRHRKATLLWSQSRAGAPFALCGTCADVLPIGTGVRS